MAYTTVNKSSSFMTPNIYTGNAGTNTLSIGFQPDLFWNKARSGSYSSGDQCWFDSQRGALYRLLSNSNNPQTLTANSLTAFNSNGVTLGSEDQSNGASTEYASWAWKAGTAVSGNTSGSGTVKTYTGTVNTTSGFSIIKYTGNGTNGMTIPHHLGAVPKMIMVKRLDASANWQIYHTSLGATKYIQLNQPSAAATSSSRWYDVEPTSSVFTLGNDSDVNVNDATFIAYSFSEKQGYQSMGSYIHNGQSGGPLGPKKGGNFIYLGFRPTLILIKNASAAGTNWLIQDIKRSPINDVDDCLFPNASSAESANYNTNFLSNGFKLSGSGPVLGSSGNQVIYYAVGQTLVGANNTPNNAF